MSIKTTKTRSLRTALISTLIWTVMSMASIQASPPTGWIKTGTIASSYDTGVTTEVSKSGSASAFIKSKAEFDEINGFATLMQNISATKYLGKRIKLSGYAKSDSLKNWAGLWMRVDGTKGSSYLAFDNMQDRPITGTTDWTHYKVVLDVAEEAGNIAYGFLLAGTGTLWVDALTVELVDAKTPVTKLAKFPQNLDFEN